MKILCTICARGGSTGVKGKNIRLLNGKPLIAYSILQARQSKLFSTIAVSSDCPQILKTASTWGADLVIERPNHLATNEAAKLPAIKHAIEVTESISASRFDFFIDLDATSPLRTANDIINAYNLLAAHKTATNLITTTAARKSPYFNIVEHDEFGFVKLSKTATKAVERRQDSPDCFEMNASIYVWKRSALFQQKKVINKQTIMYIMPEERSIDIDTELDFQLVSLLASKNKDTNDPLL